MLKWKPKENEQGCLLLTRLFNQSTEQDTLYRIDLLKKLFGKMGDDTHIEPPFRCDYGYQISIGDHFYANFDCIILDVGRVEIGSNVFFGPRVSIYAAGHPCKVLRELNEEDKKQWKEKQEE